VFLCVCVYVCVGVGVGVGAGDLRSRFHLEMSEKQVCACVYMRVLV